MTADVMSGRMGWRRFLMLVGGLSASSDWWLWSPPVAAEPEPQDTRTVADLAAFMLSQGVG